ncbi:MAG: LTA synthase family protein [Anaeromicrobium sp.]|uniref:LTA synthase family protein n=1 Tax=Anaeromicrobium sp. TaxID=1929132 RepID=UPI0025DFBC57|nr:LTA synthase family protein [Anaeromicrobium sp.]MCT4595478.1 LTA synthase family protein [Anaeromicrobium sp.]
MINRIKINFRGIPLIPSDLYLNDEILTILNVVLTPQIIKLIILSIMSVSFIIFLIINLPKLKLKMKERLILAIFSIVLLFGIININLIEGISLDRQNINCEKDGFIFSFVSSMNNKPINRSLQYIVSNMKDLEDDNRDYSVNKGIKPNIIVIMSEAFWDPSVMKEIKFSISPTGNMDKLKKTSIYGYLESPTFGGGTANSEFELLTGHSIHYFKPGYMVYPNEIKEPIMALPSILKSQGYKCKAIHTFKGWYWNRREVYKHMGFDEYLSEEYFIDPIKKGFFISDEYVTDTIIKELEGQEEPMFIFAVTMQNHGPFNDNRYKDYTKDIRVSGNVSRESLQILKTYAQGAYDADKALGKLTDYCSNLSKPTIVLFFGDHLPFLGPNYKVYREANYLSKDNINHENDIKLSSVPFLLWSNYKNDSKDLRLLNTSFMGPYLLDYAQLNMPNYFKFLRGFSREIPVINRKYIIDEEKNIINSDNEKYVAYNNDYLLVQENMFYGDKSFENKYSQWIVNENPDYNSKLNEISIKEVKIEGNLAIVKGDNFYPSSLLFINNNSCKYKYINKNEIQIKKNLLKADSNIQIKLFDSKKNLLTESNTYNYGN